MAQITLAKFHPAADSSLPIIEFVWLGATKSVTRLEGELDMPVRLDVGTRVDDAGRTVPTPGNYNVTGFRTVETCGVFEAEAYPIGTLSHDPTLHNLQDVIARVGR